MKKLFLLMILSILFLSGCGSKKPLTAEYDITGTWEYTMSELDQQDTVYDTGTITFTGTPTEGTYTLVNYYEIEYSGSYIVNKVVFGLDGGEEFRVKGSFPDADHLFGTWESGDSREIGGTGGLWTAVRK